MDTATAIVCRAFLETVSLEEKKKLLGALSPKEAKELDSLPHPLGDPKEDPAPIEDEISHVHFSWLTPFLRTLTENELKLFLGSLPPEQTKQLKGALLFTNSIPAPPPLLEEFLKETLFSIIADKDLLPKSYLPESQLNALLELNLSELKTLIDLLSMHDLAVEIRQIIETSKLNAIHALLSKAQREFLKTRLHKKEPVSFKKMGLAYWEGDPDVLSNLLVQRGINRLAKALFPEHRSLLWYVAHRLESDKGALLVKLCSAVDHPKAASLLAEEVIHLLDSIKHQQPLDNP